MKLTKPTIAYHYRGDVERGGPTTRIRWARGYSASGLAGAVAYPWLTRRECQRDAKWQGARAIFIE